MFSSNGQDDEYNAEANAYIVYSFKQVITYFHYCSTDIKLELFKSYCTLFYCCYLWTVYKKSTFDRLRVAFKFTTHTVVFSVSHGDRAAPVRCTLILVIITLKQLLENLHMDLFVQRLAMSTNSLIMAIEKSWIVRIDIWNFWQKLYSLFQPHAFYKQY